MFLYRLAHCGAVLVAALFFGDPPAAEGLLPGSRQPLKLLEQMRGSMSLTRIPNPSRYERGNYLKVLRRQSL